MTIYKGFTVENKGFWALQAPPKREKQMIHRGLFIGWQVTGVRSNALPAFERTSYLWSNAGCAVDHK
jgi:hypothetical protein